MYIVCYIFESNLQLIDIKQINNIQIKEVAYYGI